MNFVIGVFSATSVAEKAFQFCQTLLKEKHSVLQIFFYQSGVLNISDKHQYLINWTSLNIPLKICRTTALEYGLLETDLKPGFESSTLTQFFSDLFKADKYVIFAE